MFPSFLGGFAMNLYKDAPDTSFMAAITGDRLAKAKRYIEIYNDWAIQSAAISDRVRPVAVVFGETPKAMYDRAKHLLDNGIRAVWIFPAGELPGGKSPAHPDHDPLWAMLAEADCAVTVHISGAGNYLRESGWNDAPAFEGHIQHIEISRDPWFLATLHHPFENFLTVMVLGGVFDRHPRLRFGVIELTSYWVGPLIRRLDLWYNSGNSVNNPMGSKAYRLPEPPSFYFKRNVRVTPFVFEDVAKDITQYGLEDILCFSTDYPHVEGGKNCLQTFYDKVAPLGDEITEKFFVSNGEWLLPD
jgi:predicted TIM-barrel fold metal-dependent hydrolase